MRRDEIPERDRIKKKRGQDLGRCPKGGAAGERRR